MTVISPPLFLNVDSTYGPEELGIPYRDMLTEGVTTSTGLAVSQRAAGANMSVDIAKGVAWVTGDTNADTQPLYRCYNDGTVNLTVTAAHATLARKDIVIAEVRDSTFSGASNDWRLRIVDGTPAGSPAEPTLPASALKLAVITVAAAATSITNANITESRTRTYRRPGGTPAARAYRASAQSISNGAFTAVQFDNEHYDTAGMHDNATNNTRFTVPVTGIYDLSGVIYFAAAAGGLRALQWTVNNSYGVLQVYSGLTSTNEATVQAHTSALLNAGDYVELKAFQNSGGSLNIGTTDTAGQFVHACVALKSAEYLL